MISFNLSHTPLHTMTTKELSFYGDGKENVANGTLQDARGTKLERTPKCVGGEVSMRQKKRPE